MQNKIVSSIVMLCVMIFGGVLVTAPVRGQVTVGNTTVIEFGVGGVSAMGTTPFMLTAFSINAGNISSPVFWAEFRIGAVGTPPTSLNVLFPEAGTSASFTFDYTGGNSYLAREGELSSFVATLLGFNGNSLDARAIGPPGSFSMATVGSPSLVLGHAPIPEPSAYAAILGVFTLVAVATRRRRRS